MYYVLYKIDFTKKDNEFEVLGVYNDLDLLLKQLTLLRNSEKNNVCYTFRDFTLNVCFN